MFEQDKREKYPNKYLCPETPSILFYSFSPAVLGNPLGTYASIIYKTELLRAPQIVKTLQLHQRGFFSCPGQRLASHHLGNDTAAGRLKRLPARSLAPARSREGPERNTPSTQRVLSRGTKVYVEVEVEVLLLLKL